MIPIPPALKMWLTVIIVAGIGGLSQLQKDQPAWTWIGIVIAILGIVENAITVPNGARAKAQELSDKIDKLSARLGGGAGLVILLLACSQSACLPASFPSDVLKVYECVQTEIEGGVTNVGQIMLACKAPEEQVVIDAINSLLDSPKWVAEHPQLVRAMVQMGGRQR